MDSYIVRVYRRGADKAGEEIAGLVEEVGSEKKKAFQTLTGLITTIQDVVGRNQADVSDIHEMPPVK
ncbi:MAG: hypothetical protein WBP44_00485 [Gammaproteobacteria bacterium]|jgi:hypothetical protein